MNDNQTMIRQYEAELLSLANDISDNRALLDQKLADIEALASVIETAESSLLLDVIRERFDVPGHPQYNSLKYTNETQRKAALQIARDSDTAFRRLIADRNLLYAQMKDLERRIDFDRKQFRAKEIAMLFFSNNP